MSGGRGEMPNAQGEMGLKAEVRAYLLAVIADLKMQPEDGGPYYVVLDEPFPAFGATVKTVKHALQPSQMVGVFDAIFRKLGGRDELEKWRRRESARAYNEALIDASAEVVVEDSTDPKIARFSRRGIKRIQSLRRAE